MPTSNHLNILSAMSTAVERELTSVANSNLTKIYSFVGEFDQDKIQAIVSEVENKLFALECPKPTVKRVFTILLEGLQNAFLHGSSDKIGRYLGLSVTLQDSSVQIMILGATSDQQFEKVRGLVDDLSSLDKSHIKERYLQVMTNGEISDKGGAGLGLITMVMKSATGLQLKKIELEGNLVLIQSCLTV